MHTTQSYEQSSIPEDLPKALKRWNWGAFLLNWIWAIGNRCYFGLLTFVPFFGLIVPFILGAKGNQWAWKAGRWNSLADFQRAQRRWVRWALIAYAGAGVMACGLFFVVTAQLRSSPAFGLAFAELSSSAQVREQLGTPLQAGRVMGSIKVSAGGGGETDMSFDLSGPQGKGKAYAHAIQQAGAWRVEQLALVLEDGKRLDMRETTVHGARDPRAAIDPPEAAPQPQAAEPPRLPAMRVHLTNEQVNVRGAVSRDEVERALSEQRSSLEPCLAQAPGAAKLSLKLLVGPDGSVRRAAVSRTRGIDSEARECVTQAARNFKLPGPSRGTATITQNIAIAP